MDDKDLFAAPTQEESDLFAAPTQEENDLFAPPSEEEKKPVEAYLGGAFQDLSMGFSDELKGALEAAGQAVGVKGLGQEFGKQELQEPVGLDQEKLLEVYRQGRDLERQRLGQLKEESPTAYSAGEWTGTGATILASGLGGLTKKALTEGTKQAVKETGKAGLAKLAATGTAMGGTSAAGYSEADLLEQPEQLAKDVALGSAIGGTASLAIPGAIKTGKDIGKAVGRGIKKASKALTGAILNLDDKGMDYAIKNFDKIQNAMEYPEIREKVINLADKSNKMISNLSKSTRNMLSGKEGTKKYIPKKLLIERLENKIQTIKGTADEPAIKEIEGIIDYIKGSQIKEIPYNDALNKAQDQINKIVKDAEKKGYTANFQQPEWDLKKGVVSILGMVDGQPKLIQQKIKPQKVVPNRFDGDLLSLQDLHDVVRDTGKRVYYTKGSQQKDTASIMPVLRETYSELSETLKELVPNKNFRKGMKEIHDNLNKLNEFNSKFNIDSSGSKMRFPDEDIATKKLQEVGKELGLGAEYEKSERLLNELQEYAGKPAQEDTITELLKQRRIKGILEGGKEYSGVAGGSSVTSKVRGFSAKPVAKKALEIGSKLSKKDISGKTSKLADKAASASAIPALAGALKSGTKIATSDKQMSDKLDNSDNLENLIQEFETSDQPSKQNYAEELKRYQEADTEREKMQLRYNLQQQPTFRKLLDEYDELNKKK